MSGGNDTTDSSVVLNHPLQGMHSDYTVPTSNLRRYIHSKLGNNTTDASSDQYDSLSPPTDLILSDSDHLRHIVESSNITNSLQSSTTIKHTNKSLDGTDVITLATQFTNTTDVNEEQPPRRQIFNTATKRRYYCGSYHTNGQPQPPSASSLLSSQPPTNDEQLLLSTLWDGKIPPQHLTGDGVSVSNSTRSSSSSSRSSTTSYEIPFYTSSSNGIWAPIGMQKQDGAETAVIYPNTASPFSHESSRSISTTPEKNRITSVKDESDWKCCRWCTTTTRSRVSPRAKRKRTTISSDLSNVPVVPMETNNHTTPADTRHAQALILGWAFAAVWSGCNVTAPNLTSMANDFGFYTEASRDWYLGSVLALVQTIASLPIAAVIGLLTDVVPSRQKLFIAIIIAGSASSTLGAISWRSYYLLVLSRWLSGACMAGSVPVAFSLLSDWFDATERNIASSGLTALMGLGIIGGQVYAGIATSTLSSNSNDWTRAFVASAVVQVLCAMLCMFFVQDPIRGGREAALQALMKEHGKQAYDRPMTWSSLRHAIWNNASNAILLWQGFFSSIPWGVMFVFLNDFLSQERGFSVPDATFLVAVFGIGCAAGGIIGGYVGQIIMDRFNRSYLPLFMAVTTALGIIPFIWLLNSTFLDARGFRGVALTSMGGLIASLPSVLVRPCILNVNPPETRGAAMTTANLLVQLGRGIGPTCITIIQTLGNYILARFNAIGLMADMTVIVDRRFAFNVVLIMFWSISALQMLFLMKTLPGDQDSMEAELAKYATERAKSLSRKQSNQDLDEQQSATGNHIPENGYNNDSHLMTESQTSKSVVPMLVAVQERINSFDNIAAQQTIQYVRAGMQELQFSPFHCHVHRGDEVPSSPSSNDDSETPMVSGTLIDARRALWQEQDVETVSNIDTQWTDETLLLQSTSSTDPHGSQHPTETTPLL
jgi:translation initiation factor 4G